MGFYYKIYGLNFYSEDLKFPQLIPYLNHNVSFDIKILKEEIKKMAISEEF